MGRLLFFVLLAAAIYFAWRWLRVSQARPPASGATRDSAKPAAEPMVRCAHCGVHLPLSEAVADGTNVYCSDPHRLAGPRPRG